MIPVEVHPCAIYHDPALSMVTLHCVVCNSCTRENGIFMLDVVRSVWPHVRWTTLLRLAFDKASKCPEPHGPGRRSLDLSSDA